MGGFGGNLPPGVSESDPDAPWNEPDPDDPRCKYPKRCKCRECQDDAADYYYEQAKDRRLEKEGA